MRVFLFTFLLFASLAGPQLDAADYRDVHAIFEEHCIDCHGSEEPDGNLVLEDFAGLMRGGENGASVIAGRSGESLLTKFIEGTIEKEGKRKIMPPGKREKLDASEIALVKAWIDAGALPPTETIVRELKVPAIAPKNAPKKRVLALAYHPEQDLLAAAHYGEVAVLPGNMGPIVRTLPGSRGSINDVAFSTDGKFVFAASGENALQGEVKQWNVADGSLVRTYEGHKDILYSLAISPDGGVLATGSYDQKIKLWDTATGKEIKTLHGHNGAVFGLAFRPDGKILASASGDRTVKLWDVVKGERVDTLSQPLKEVYCVAWSRDGRRLYAGGRDNRIRVWEVSESAFETTNPLRESRFAHEGTILRLEFSPDGKSLLSSADDRTVKLWDATTLRERLLFEKQSDWVAGLCFNNSGEIILGRMDGTFGRYDAKGRLLSDKATAAISKQQ